MKMAVSTVSYTKTPQAGDDSFTNSEDIFTAADYTGSILLDVLANDLGGKAKSLYSIDDGTGALAELLTKDPNLSTVWENTADGNLIRMNCGKIEFKLADDFDVNSLAAGDTYTD
ncbi:MAG: hypothetical protein AAB654_12015, partial [Acidobacteriota bacterium]